ncbi:MAG: tRNA (N6-isopentenyl adenosine(37)-C2)-methylthiotransferase MiaB [Proteobacteria bacterium]|nr:tRNA (N6-isopentenyl adenosine(37)-C2)-methylthiotransferase MiaB [Pseudomonadota bacterium]
MFIKSYGCQMNVYDGLRMAEMMAPHGYRLAPTADAADLIILNTCHIREKADDKVFSDIGRMRRQANKSAIIAVGGCTGQAMGASLMQQAPAVQIVFGPQTLHRLPQLLEKVQSGSQKRAVDTDFPELEKFDNLPTPGAYGPSAFVTIQEGCDKFCTYCVVPYTRGAEISRPAADILAECQALATQGVREITLLGQNVNAYQSPVTSHQSPVTLAKLCEQIGAIAGIERIRFTTSHPNNTSPDLIAAFATNPKLMPYFHLPIQAGSNRILQAMNRNHTVESYLATIAQVRAAQPHIAISGDFIVGFPGETEDDFAQTLQVAATVGFVGAYSFAYSPRPGTPAADLPNQVDELTKKERLAALQAVLDHTTEAFLTQFIGQTISVLVEGPGGQPGQLRGRSPHNMPVNFTVENGIDPASLPGQLVEAEITHAGPKSLLGRLARS